MMRLKVILWILLGVVSCFGADLQSREWMVGGVKREALVWVPDAIPTNGCPLVFAFHGHGGSMGNAARSFRIHQIWPESMVVYMDGLPTASRLVDPEGLQRGWNANPGQADNRDLKFFDAVYASLVRQANPARVYCMGHSNGGSFTYCLWAARGDLFAAVAPSGALSMQSLSTLKSKPALHLAGKTDPLVKYVWQDRMIQAVKRVNGCGEGKPWPSSGTLTGTQYYSSTGTPLVTLIHPGGHTFPKEASELMVRFFKEHVRK